MSGNIDDPRPKTQILGNEFSGEIEAIGKDVKSFQLGDWSRPANLNR